ncbi:unnamed protein product [Ilex paraguariensis]|uniref:Uncharacterized protein n=1 Tax=Ilex paraguariensis TaxID=185542 RepID=A0ABC8SJI2_9AQUA
MAPRCSVCQVTGFDHPIFKGVYNCLCEVNSDLKVLGGNFMFSVHLFAVKLGLRMAGFPIGESKPMVMAREISPHLSDIRVKGIRKALLRMKVLAMISMKFDSNEIPPDWRSSDLSWSGRINASGDFSLELEGVSSTEVQKIDIPGYFLFNELCPKFHFRVLIQMLDDPEQYESVDWVLLADMFKKKLNAPELGISPGTSSSSEVVADYPPPRDGSVILDMPAETLRQSNFQKISPYSSEEEVSQGMGTARGDIMSIHLSRHRPWDPYTFSGYGKDSPVGVGLSARTGGSKLYEEFSESERLLTARAHLFYKEYLEPVMSTKNLEAPKLDIDPGTRSFMEKFGKRPVTVPVHCYEQTYTSFGGGNAETPEDVIKIPGKVILSFQSVAAEEHVIDFCEQMPETKKIIPVIRFSNEATDPPAKLNEIVIGITGQAAFSIMGYALTGSSSSPASYFVVGATAIGFICTLIALTLKGTKKPEARILGKVGAMAAACAVIVAMGMFLPANTIWTTGIAIACLIAVVAVALA